MQRMTLMMVPVMAAVLAASTTATAGVPQMINYQGRLTDSTGSPLDTNVAMTFRIYRSFTGGDSVWSETHASVAVQSGLFNVILGSTNPISDTVFNDTVRYLGITVGSDQELTQRTRLVSVSYSQRVSTVDGASGGVISGDVSIQSDLSVSGKATIGPGHTNTGAYAFVAGANNRVSGDYGTVGGGQSDTASGGASTVSGGYGNVAGADRGAIGGGALNSVNAYAGTVSGGEHNLAGGNHSTVGGGLDDTASGGASTVGGGVSNVAGADRGTVGGGAMNSVSAYAGTVSGGEANSASGNHSTVSGGHTDTASGGASTVGGGYLNVASAGRTTVGGGALNSASGYAGIVGGGETNLASGQWSTVGGGLTDTAGGDFSTVCGGVGNTASGQGSIVIGGSTNSAGGQYGTILGGVDDTLTSSAHNSIAFGKTVYVNNSYRAAFFTAGNPGYLKLNRDDLDGAVLGPITVGIDGTNGNGAHLTAGGVWTNGSSREFKEDFETLDGEDVLKRIEQLPMEAWGFKGTGERHIWPCAEDFHEQFDVGVLREDGTRDTKYLAAGDIAGVALIGVKQLATENQELRRRIEELESLVEALLATNGDGGADRRELASSKQEQGPGK